MAPLWRTQHWFWELARLLTAAPWPIPLRRDLLSQVNGTIWHPALSMGATSLASRWEPSVLPENVLNTISQARAPSTRRLYALKWSVFSAWCTNRGADSEVCDISLILYEVQYARSVGKGSLRLHAQGLCSSYSSLTRSYRWPISGQEQVCCSFSEGV